MCVLCDVVLALLADLRLSINGNKAYYAVWRHWELTRPVAEMTDVDVVGTEEYSTHDYQAISVECAAVTWRVWADVVGKVLLNVHMMEIKRSNWMT